MRVAYFDCFSGISGDMCLGALLHAGGNLEALVADLARLGVHGWRVQTEAVTLSGISALSAHVRVDDGPMPHRHLADITQIISNAALPPRVADRATRVFTRLADAEASVHGTTPSQVHFHEVGGVDAIIDIVGSALLMEQLGIDALACSPLPMGHGTIECAHGTIPLPAPAVVELTRGFATYGVDTRGELVTPTGAALMTTLAAGPFGPSPTLTQVAAGYGAGKKVFGPTPNMVRVIIGDVAVSQPEAVLVDILEANIDDMAPELLAGTAEDLMAAGALDVTLTPTVMKKGRPAITLTVLCRPHETDAIADRVFSATSTFGVRITSARRICLDRRWEPVPTDFGTVRVKLGIRDAEVITASPEYADVLECATSFGVPLRTVHAAAMAAYHKKSTSR